MATFVFVHGAWGGGWAWKLVSSLLRANGHEVFTPTLTGLGERVHLATPKINLDTHIRLTVLRTFIRCPVDGEVWAGMYDPLMERLRNDPRWQVRELPSNHLAPIAAPSLVARILLEII